MPKRKDATATTHSIRSVVDFLKLIEKLELSGEEVVFRGQSSEWPLVPDLGRLPFLSQGKAYDSWLGFEDDLLDKFRKYSYPFLPVHTRSDWDWLYIARHYGLPTRLLDWSTNPLKALFFAVQDFRSDDKDAVLWALQTKGWMESLEHMNRATLKDMHLVYPAHINERIVAQDACFTVFPLPARHKEFRAADQERLVSRAIRFRISAAMRLSLRVELSALGFTQRTIFPGLDGVVASIRQYFGEGWLK